MWLAGRALRLENTVSRVPAPFILGTDGMVEGLDLGVIAAWVQKTCLTAIYVSTAEDRAAVPDDGPRSRSKAGSASPTATSPGPRPDRHASTWPKTRTTAPGMTAEPEQPRGPARQGEHIRDPAAAVPARSRSANCYYQPPCLPADGPGSARGANHRRLFGAGLKYAPQPHHHVRRHRRDHFSR
jgi:hypothetical protein